MITAESIRRLKAAVPLLQEVQAHVKLKRSAATWLGLCPFHREKTPSFVVHDRSDKTRPDYWHCFAGCKGGDVIDFTAAIEGVSKGRAIRLLAERYDIDLDAAKQTRPQQQYTADLQKQAEFWWERRRAMMLAKFEGSTIELFAAAEAAEPTQNLVRKAVFYGQVLQWMDRTTPIHRGRLFTRLRTDEDLKVYRDAQQSLQWLNSAVAGMDFGALVDLWASGRHVEAAAA